jgi:hypothetical protein
MSNEEDFWLAFFPLMLQQNKRKNIQASTVYVVSISQEYDVIVQVFNDFYQPGAVISPMSS